MPWAPFWCDGRAWKAAAEEEVVGLWWNGRWGYVDWCCSSSPTRSFPVASPHSCKTTTTTTLLLTPTRRRFFRIRPRTGHKEAEGRKKQKE